jgi:hypothetical protein
MERALGLADIDAATCHQRRLKPDRLDLPAVSRLNRSIDRFKIAQGLVVSFLGCGEVFEVDRSASCAAPRSAFSAALI